MYKSLSAGIDVRRPKNLGTMQSPFRIVWEIYLDPFTSALPDTWNLLLSSRCLRVAPCAENTGTQNVIQSL